MILIHFFKLVIFSFSPGNPIANLVGLVVGDKLGFTATYSSSTTRFGVNLMDADNNYVFRIAFRQAGDIGGPISVMSSRTDGIWGAESRAAFPAFEDGVEFCLMIECQFDKFVVSFNGVPLEGVEFPYRYDLASVAAIKLWGGAAKGDGNAIFWNTFTLPVAQHNPDPAEEDPEN